MLLAFYITLFSKLHFLFSLFWNTLLQFYCLTVKTVALDLLPPSKEQGSRETHSCFFYILSLSIILFHSFDVSFLLKVLFILFLCAVLVLTHNDAANHQSQTTIFYE